MWGSRASVGCTWASIRAPAGAPAGAAPTQSNSTYTGERKTEFVGRMNYTSKQLFEVSGAVNIAKQFPEPIAFVTFIPGIPDASKATGITYNQAAKETMKIHIRDLFGLSKAIEQAAMVGQCDFVVYTDSSKFAGSTTAVTKQLSIGAGEWKGKVRVYINYKGQGQIQLSLDKWHALGVAEQLKVVAQETLKKKMELERNYTRS